MDALAVTKASEGRAVGLALLGTALTAADQLAHVARDHVVLHATDDDPAGIKAAGREYSLLTARGIDVRKLVLTDGERGLNDPPTPTKPLRPAWPPPTPGSSSPRRWPGKKVLPM